MIHCFELMGNDESEKVGIYFQGLSGSRYCDTRIMPWFLVHDIISKYPPRKWCLFFCHVASLLKHISGEEKNRVFFFIKRIKTKFKINLKIKIKTNMQNKIKKKQK